MRNERETSETRETPVYDAQTADASPEIAPATLTPNRAAKARNTRAAKGKTRASEATAIPKARKSRLSLEPTPRPARKASKTVIADNPAPLASVSEQTEEAMESPAAASVSVLSLMAAKARELANEEAALKESHTGTLDDEAEGFFNAPPSADYDHVHSGAHAIQGSESLAPTEHDVAGAPPVLPHAHARRMKLARVVRVAVAVSAALCLAAVVRGAVARVGHEREAMASTMTDRASSGDGASAVVARPVTPETVIAESVTAPSAAAAAEPAPSPVAEAVAESPAVVVDDAPPARSAAEEKKTTRRALERGKLKDAIAAGERSIAIDPSDGETWLLLGAAYQDSGNGKEARRCFSECTKQAKRGPINECRMMLR